MINKKENFCSYESLGRYYPCENGLCNQEPYEADSIQITSNDFIMSYRKIIF